MNLHITANSRLSATLKSRAIPQGIQVCETPQVMTLPQWWQQWQEACLLNGELPIEALPDKVLSDFESLWLWEQALQSVLQDSSSDQNEDLSTVSQASIALLNVSSTAKQLQQAWVLSQEWLPESWLDSPYLSQESHLFKQCQQHYLNALKARNWQDSVLAQQQALAWLAQGKGRLPKQFTLHGFDDIPPFMQQWQRLVEARGVLCEIAEHASNDSPSKQADGYAAQDEQDEVQQVALWCVAQWHVLSKSKPAHEIKIGVVSPNLADYKATLTQCLDEQLYMHGLQPLQTHRSAPPFYNLSLGVPLLECPLVQNALLSLQLFLTPNKPCLYQDWSQWLTSAYTLGSWVQRQQADAAFRQLQWASFCWPTLLETKAANALPNALKQVLSLAQKILPPPTLKTLNEFIAACRTVLQQIKWGTERSLNSDEFQQKTAFESALHQFSLLADIQQKQSVSAWLSLFKRFLAEQLHQSQSKGLQPIQIMGMLEAGGQPFDALWVLGMTDEAWPRAANPNPFLPMALQREVMSPRCDAKRELAYAQQVTERLAHSATQLVWSYAKQKGDAEQLMSPLIQALNLSSYEAKLYNSLAKKSFQQHATSPVEWVLDAQGPEMAEGSKAPGGTGFLQAQSQCPLMAFMDYRLGAKYGLQTVEDGLQNNNQGILVHAILEHFWQETQTQVALLALSEEALQARLQVHIEHAFATLASHLDSAYLTLEKARLAELCLGWLQLEKTRPSFKVVQTEQRHEIILSYIQFNVVIDRVDECTNEGEGGGKFILDYKTGKARIEDLLKFPNKAPQLAVYLFAVQDEISGIGYGILHSDDGVKISAMVQDSDVLALPKASRSIKDFSKLSEKKDGDYFDVQWQDFLEDLKSQVWELAGQIQQGHAPMVFAKEDDTQYAHCKLALRLPEVKAQKNRLLDKEVSA